MDSKDENSDYNSDEYPNRNKILTQIYQKSSSLALFNSSQINDSEQQQDDVYVFIKFLGRGAFGSVNLYRHTKENLLVAWKEIDLNGIEERDRFEINSEIEILASLDHPNIITYYKHFLGDNCLYIELEYSNGGNLMQIIKEQKSLEQYFSEDIIIWYLYQVLNAVEYIHDQQILHRDIKSLNIFSNKAGLLKLGDFGLAKRLDPEVGLAKTQIGTPYYMAPEILNNESYNSKSDIWAVGCVLYELLTLTKAFEASNPLKLAMRILVNDITDVGLEIYSRELKDLVKIMLSKDPKLRLSAKEILASKIFSTKILEFDAKIENLNTFNRRSRGSGTGTNAFGPVDSNETLTGLPIVASKLSESYIWGGGKLLPQILETFKREKAPLQVCVGVSHYAVITVEKELYTWAITLGGGKSSSHAKLGYGKTSGLSRVPKRVESFNGNFIKQVVCGEDFTCCISDDGTLYAFGTNYSGCLGVTADDIEEIDESGEMSDGNDEIYKPIAVPYFSKNSIKIAKVACGDSHVVCLTEDNEIYTWGCGEFGRLGHGDENDVDTPRKLNFRVKYKFKNVFAGPDCSFLVTNKGKVLAFGNNEYNKLGLNDVVVRVQNDQQNKNINSGTSDIQYQLTPKLVKSLKNYTISKIASGNTHTAAIDMFGRLFTFGSNKFGQLGVNDCKKRTGINIVTGALIEHHVINVACGDTFTICATAQNHVFSWGNRKDGRLGLDSTFISKEEAICLPKPIFGSLYLVSDMCSKGWNSIIIAERIIEAKPVRSISYKSMVSVTATIAAVTEEAANANNNDFIDSDYGTYASNRYFDQINENNAQNESDAYELERSAHVIFDNMAFNDEKKSIGSSNMPDWLRNDLKSAEYIPIPQPKELIIDDIKKENSQSSSATLNDSESQILDLDEAIRLIKQLKAENLKLKEDNEKLKMELKQNLNKK